MKLPKVLQVAGLAGVSALIPWGLGLEGELARGVALFSLIGLLWLTETLHVTATALLVPVLAVLLGLLDMRAALSGFAHPVIFLFLGGFALASALQTHGLDQTIAALIVRLARGHLLRAMLLSCVATAFLSMWISNTAATAMVLPLALGLLAGREPKLHRASYAFLLLGVAWSANIGGIATLVGSPPNAIAAAHANISFGQWMQVGLPIVVVLLPCALLLLWLLLRPRLSAERAEVPKAAALAPGSHGVLLIFTATLCAWVFSAPLAKWLGIAANMDALIAMLAVLALLISGRLQWQDLESHVNWGVLLLFGGGITLSTVMSSSGASAWLGERLHLALANTTPWVFLLIITGFVVFLTELVSNTASAALLVPLFVGAAEMMGIEPQVTAMLIGVAASCAFMLPVATPPNALVFGTGLLRQQTMMRVGVVMNLLAILPITLLVSRLA